MTTNFTVAAARASALGLRVISGLIRDYVRTVHDFRYKVKYFLHDVSTGPGRPTQLWRERPHFQCLVRKHDTDGPELWQRACALGLEGIVSKRKDARYQSGRIDTWTKTPCKKRETFVIPGWAEKGTKFDGFYLGEERDGKLACAGKIEGGWTDDQKADLLARVRPLRTRHPPFALDVTKPKARWVEPRILIDVEYRAMTAKSGLLRHPSYKGLRPDLIE